ncbi:hypothetical protein Tco_0821698 [Tanacetum coccineum]|uniref:Reverse transcriptase Ty1/copia-type domain-containing protein n=1 Tax=Tanacetum coccineum TaxID=301880 RepID=A0ABQ5AER8_9ASTR
MYLTASHPDIAFATFVCARYQTCPTVKHLEEVKRIFRYLRQSYNMGLWYLKDSGFELIAYSDAEHAGCKDDCKSTSGGLQFLGGKLLFGCVHNCLTVQSIGSSAVSTRKQNTDEYHQESSFTIQYCCFFLCTMDLYGTVDGSKYRLKFMLDKKELSLTLDDFRTVFHLPQANDNNHNSFVSPPSFSEMVPFYKQQLGFTMELNTSSSFKTTSLLQPWQTLCKIFSKWRHKDNVGMQILDWMITEEIKQTEHYRMYVEVFGLDVPLI